ncbi:MAG: thioredoxin domain-containing protein [Thiotrichales bacterium]|jgi:uncharacterized protein|nr:thioredoxin domain-containing protein [Thiotrichales bacterium]MBT3613779.1 thioredoxin domain-containing protein [Thiotrichales bacterium]MBT4972343.1 thioredoxin domain-containing protein [Thiotrichales bacterium]MBT6172405.1 thioredoxin domain-containing protein [Thiotrichales bacterium]MBT7006001.1 thioredoxin domain-containing protein [Thiotrichales bacterium]
MSPLQKSPSQYLRMHSNDPVEWSLWSRDLLELAQQSGRPIFLSSGYFSCHWCHVMQQESFKNSEIAQVINRTFLAVKIDRELSPLLDKELMDFTERTTGTAGWPLQVVITPDGTPLLGFIYLPPERFLSFLLNFESKWRSDSSALTKLAHSVVADLMNSSLPKKLHSENATEILTDADMLDGGFGEERKYPEHSRMQRSLDILQSVPSLTNREELKGELREFLELTLDSMAERGLHDTLDGGFFRYTIDPNWETPHFEKMLYDNAQLATLYLRAGAYFKSEKYSRVGVETLEFILRSMRNEDTLFISSISALNSEGEEGGYYLWDMEELNSLLGRDDAASTLPQNLWQQFKLLWMPNSVLTEGGLHLFMPLKATTVTDRVTQLNIFNKLRQARSKRSAPVDEKVLAGWNGLALTAYAELIVQSKNLVERGVISQEQAVLYRESGEIFANTLVDRFWNGVELYRLYQEGYKVEAAEEDYSQLSRGLEQWGLATGKSHFIDTAKSIRRVGANLQQDSMLRYKI